jgi:endoglucanase
LSFRYFIDLGDVLAAGHRVDEVNMQISWVAKARLSPLHLWPGSSSLYFVEVDFSGIPIFPGGEDNYRKEVRLTISLRDMEMRSGAGIRSANQWSLQDLSDIVTKTMYIPVYEGDTHLFGREPAMGVSVRELAAQP